ncbi:Uncharacterised protein [Mycobacteroides abscessus subsp. abscessus]|nr:Uncharacterised protein [Mycobacteroides abscessus subsp. abscessus]
MTADHAPPSWSARTDPIDARTVPDTTDTAHRSRSPLTKGPR